MGTTFARILLCLNQFMNFGLYKSHVTIKLSSLICFLLRSVLFLQLHFDTNFEPSLRFDTVITHFFLFQKIGQTKCQQLSHIITNTCFISVILYGALAVTLAYIAKSLGGLVTQVQNVSHKIIFTEPYTSSSIRRFRPGKTKPCL